MEIEYMRESVKERIALMKERYYMYCRGVNEAGQELSYKVACNARSATLRDWQVLILINELLDKVKSDTKLSIEAHNGFDKIVTPNEKHRRLLNAGV